MEHEEQGEATLLERMQTPEAKKRVQKGFDASPEELGRVAAEAAKKNSGT